MPHLWQNGVEWAESPLGSEPPDEERLLASGMGCMNMTPHAAHRLDPACSTALHLGQW